jgi:hypothetical protein
MVGEIMTTHQFDVIEIAARMEYNGTDDVVNVFQYELQSGADVTDAQTVVDVLTIIEVIYAFLTVLQSTLLLYRDLRVTNVTHSVLLGTTGWPTLTAGTHVGDAAPPGSASLLNFFTNISKVAPKKYFGGFVVDVLDFNGSWNVSMGVQAASILGYMLVPVAVGGNTWQYGYLSPKTLSFKVPVSGTWRDVVAYQRRRKPGRGS